MRIFGTTNYRLKQTCEFCKFHCFTTLINYAYPRLPVATKLYRSTMLK
nr:MAG TPA: hypothetical protein [Caudoviricetes sp.]DAY38101.1 MAG TPA: hypothetical protein [Caudoviricetes sp.]